jgi:hypothetical protein
MSEHLGYDKGDQAGRNRGNSRNGKRSKTVITEAPPESWRASLCGLGFEDASGFVVDG